MNKSIATISSPEFINLQTVDINPLMSSCEIKVLYVGENRNGSFISKEVATEMSKTLRGAPIVGYYKQEKEDFADHGQIVTIDDEGIHYDCATIPYGFVSPDAKVWFQEFEDYDDFGNVIANREYLMTTGYLWTGQFKECASAVSGEGKPQSMELDDETLNGKWSTNSKTGMDFFIINDAVFSKLCILGDDVEPCFEGASIGTPETSLSFSLNNDFKNTLFSMMEDLKEVVSKTGGRGMEDYTDNNVINDNNIIVNNQPELSVSNSTVEDFAKKDKDKNEDDKKDEPVEDTKAEDNKNDDESKEKEEEDKDKKAKTKHSLEVALDALTKENEELTQNYSALKEKYDELVAFKQEIEDKEKDELINGFYMLSDDDKKDVIEHKSEYSYDDIEAKLSVICVRKKVNFNLDDENDNNKPSLTFNLSDEEDTSDMPDWAIEVYNNRKKK